MKTPEQPFEQDPADLKAFRPNRRTILRGGLGAVGLGLFGGATKVANPTAVEARSLGVARSSTIQGSATGNLAVFPINESRTASPGTEITFRGVSGDDLGHVIVIGSRSGAHSGALAPHSDAKGFSWVPDAAFRPGERITVQADIPLTDTSDGVLAFTIAQPISPAKVAPVPEESDAELNPQKYVSRPDLAPTVIDITDSSADAAPGFIFVGPRQVGAQTGPMILDGNGETVWFHPLPGVVDSATDVKVQEYKGKPVLTWWEGTSTQGHGFGHFVIYDQSYTQIASVQPGNGFAGGDLHDFLLTPQGTALIPVYNVLNWDLRSVDGPKDGIVMDGIVQEIDIETGRVLFEWHSLDHIAVKESKVALPPKTTDTYDYFHLNAVEIDPDDNIIVNARNAWAAYKIDRATAEVIWRISGAMSDFQMGDGTEVAFQHDSRMHSDNKISFFNNATDSPDSGEVSRGVVLDLDIENMTATLAQEYVHPTNIVSVSQGNNQLQPNGNAFVGWGSAPVFSEFSPDGDLLFNGRFPKGVTSYRAYRFTWVGQPTEAPAVAVRKGDGNDVTAYASWNGATEVASWRVLAGSDPDKLQEVGSGERTGFETTIKVQTAESYISAEALDSSGKVLGTAMPIETSS